MPTLLEITIANIFGNYNCFWHHFDHVLGDLIKPNFMAPTYATASCNCSITTAIASPSKSTNDTPGKPPRTKKSRHPPTRRRHQAARQQARPAPKSELELREDDPEDDPLKPFKASSRLYHHCNKAPHTKPWQAGEARARRTRGAARHRRRTPQRRWSR